MNIFNNSCDLQAFGNVLVMIIAAIFGGIRMSRCKYIETPCWKCQRELVDESELATNV